MRRIASLLAMIAVSLTVTVLLLWRDWSSHAVGQIPPPPPISPAAINALLALSLPDTAGRVRMLAEWRDSRVLVINYWASWCKPCRTEMPALSALYARYRTRGLQVVGIAADSAEQVDDYVRTMPVTYPLLVGGQGAIRLTREFGNEPQAVPFTIVLDRTGTVRAAILGVAHGAAMDRLLADLL